MSTSSFEKDQRPGIAPAVDAGVVRMNGAVSNQTGTVKWFNLHKGFGFIRPSTGGGDVFVHISALEKVGLYALEERQPVAFDLEEDPESGRMSAVNLKILG